MASKRAAKEEKTEGQSNDVAPCCWICLDNEQDDEGKPVLRDCSCRGDDAGFVHVSCIVEYARMKNIEEEKKAAQSGKPVNFFDINDPWRVCPTCKKTRIGEVGMSLGATLLKDVQDIPDQKAHHFAGLFVLADAFRSASNYPEAIKHFKLAIDLIERNQEIIQSQYADDVRVLTLYVTEGIASAFGGIGDMESSISYRKKCASLASDIFGENHPETKRIRHDLCIEQDELKVKEGRMSAMDLQNRYVSLLREKHEISLSEKQMLALDYLHQGKKAEEGLRLLDEVFQAYLREFGPDNPSTQSAAHMYQCCKSVQGLKMATIIGSKFGNGMEVEVLKLRKDGKYQVKMNVEGTPKEFKVSPDNLMFHNGTFVRILSDQGSSEDQGMVSAFDEQKKMYTLKSITRSGIREIKVKAKNCLIAFRHG